MAAGVPGRIAIALLLTAVAACSGVNLGDIDESVDSREQMSGPGILADDQGESALSWRSKDSSTKTEEAAPATASEELSAEQVEFEQYKEWKALREQGGESSEYREFQQWREYQEFKSGE